MDYRHLSLAEVSAGLDAVARDAEHTFGSLDAAQLNWKPDDERWSVGQCFEHLVTINGFMLQAAEHALDGTALGTIWQQVPGASRMFGRLLITALSPASPRKLTAPPAARPSASAISPDV